MTAHELKNAILQLAVQGKLVPQDPSEGTGKDLYNQIQAEKTNFIKEGRIKKEKPLAELSEEEIPFDIPNSWKWVRLNSIITLLSGADLTSDKYNAQSNGIPYITGASNFEGDTIIINRWTEYPNNIAHKGDLLLSCKGTVGKTIVLSEDSVHIARQIMAIRSFVADIEFIQFYIQRQVEHLRSKAKSMIPGIDRNNVLQLPFPLPPLAEQERIVAKIEELLPLVEEYGKAEEKLTKLNAEFPDKLRKSILQQAIQGKLTERDPADEPASELLKRIRADRQILQKCGKAKASKATEIIDEDEITFELPDNWTWVKLGWICQKVGAGSTPKGGAAVYVSNGIKFLREQNIHDDGLHLDGIVYIDSKTNEQKTGSIVQPRDILMNITGGSIGRNALVPDDFDIANINQHILIIRLIDKDLRQYLHLCFSSPFVLNQMYSKQIGDKPGLSATKVENFVVPLPPLAEQQRIVDRVNELLSLCDELK